MAFSLVARRKLDADLERLEREQVIVLELAELRDLVCEPDLDPFAGRPGPERAGVEDLGATLAAARRLPEDLTVRIVLAEGAGAEPRVDEAEAALHRRAAYLATVAWREGMAQRAMGYRQLPLGLTIAAVAWAAAYVLGYLATQVDGAGIGLLAVSAMVSITIAWVVSWWVIETTMLDWRPGARQAAAYELLARARLEVTAAVGAGA